MTITGMTRFVQQNYKVQNSHLTHKLPNGSLPPKEHVNPYCPEEWILQVEQIFAALSLLTRALQIR